VVSELEIKNHDRYLKIRNDRIQTQMIHMQAKH